jgi:hypothetical protein
MAEVLVEFTEPVTAEGGRRYVARACGAGTESGKWHGWLEFTDVDTGEVIRSGRETTQPNRTDTRYWATGLSAVYLEGALQRARHPLAGPSARSAPRPRFDEPAGVFTSQEGILDPFAVYRNGERLLRRQLRALSGWHLANIVRAHRLSDVPQRELDAMPAESLVELIVAAVRGSGEDPAAMKAPGPADRADRTAR